LPPGTRLAILPENEGADYPIYDESLDDENTIDGELLPCQDRADGSINFNFMIYNI
jgi:hypothetical protein